MECYRRPVAVILLLILLPVFLSADDDLWEQAMNHAALGYADQAVLMTMESWETNRHGERTSTKVIEVGRNPETWEFVVVSAVEDGKDVTAKEQRKAAKQQEDGSNRQFIHPIFDPEKAVGLTLSPRETTGIIGGLECRIYDFRLENEWPMGPGRPKPVVEEGILFIALENGMPLRIDSSLVEGPNMIKSMTYRLGAYPGPGDDWRVDRMDMEFVGKMIVYKAGGVTIRFDYEDS